MNTITKSKISADVSVVPHSPTSSSPPSQTDQQTNMKISSNKRNRCFVLTTIAECIVTALFIIAVLAPLLIVLKTITTNASSTMNTVLASNSIVTSAVTTIASTASVTIVTTTFTTTCSPIFAGTSGLIAYFPMDSSPSYLTDVNGTVTATAVNVTSVAGERNQALLFFGLINSYFQVNNLTSLGVVNAPFSIALYINPNVLSGTLVHISMFKNGTTGWCLPFIGFASSTQLATQIWGGSTANYVLGPIPPLYSWTHVVQTWSSANGLSLYINGALYGQDNTVTAYSASGVGNYLTVASTILAIPYPASGCSATGVLGGMGYYNGSVDELRVYNRELSALEVCALAKY